MNISPVTAADLPELAAIYAHHVLHGTGTFEATPPSAEEMEARWQAGTAGPYDWLAARDATGVLGFAFHGPYRPRPAYAATVENSVYVRDDVRGQGVGKELVAALVGCAAARGYRQMLAFIGDSENIGSIGVHSSLGFRHVGTMRGVGCKFGRILDVVVMQRELRDETRP